MTKTMFSTCLMAMMAIGCTKAQLISDLPEDINKPEDGSAVITTAKRGVCQSTSTSNFGQKLVELKANWYYTWGLDPSILVEGVEFVPMFWGASSVTESNCNKINQLYEEGRINYVLGFNEPDLAAESNMSVSEALDLWEFLCNHLDNRIKLVSPAPSYPVRDWMDEFMAGVSERGLRCDYVAVHMYAGIGTQNYQSVIREVYSKYGKKVWVTEFAPRDDNASGNGYNSYSESKVLDWMEEVIPAYEEMDAIFRYSMFGCASESMLGLITSRFFDSSDNITSLGEYYSSIEPNEEISLAE